MSNFSHISDEDVSKYLEEGSDDYNVVAKQLDYSWDCMSKDLKDKLVSAYDISLREEFYQEACDYFSMRNLGNVHKALKKFWSV